METGTDDMADATPLTSIALDDLFAVTDDDRITVVDDRPDAIALCDAVLTRDDSGITPEYEATAYATDTNVLDAFERTEGVMPIARGRDTPGAHGPTVMVSEAFDGVEGVEGRACVETVELSFKFNEKSPGVSYQPTAYVSPVTVSRDGHPEIVGFEVSVSSSPGASGIRNLVLNIEA